MLTAHRTKLGLTQSEYAALLGVSQPYLSQLESKNRPLTQKLQAKLSQAFKPTDLPLELSETELDDATLANTLATLGYPGFAHLPKAPSRNPAALVLECLRKANLDVRTLQGLPWLLAFYSHMDLDWLVDQAKLKNLQNRLGYLTTLAAELFRKPHLDRLLDRLEPARLASVQTLCFDGMTKAERNWLQQGEQPPQAKHWNLLTDLKASSLKRGNLSHVHAH